MPVLVRGTVQMKQGEIGMSFRHAPGKFLVIGRFLEKIVSALLPFLIIPGISEPPVRTLRATIPENERHIFR